MAGTRRRWLKWVGLGLLLVTLGIAGLVVRVLLLRAEHQKLRDAEVGRAPVAAPKRSKVPGIERLPVITNPGQCLRGQVLDHGRPVVGMQVSVPDALLSVTGPCACRACQCSEGLTTLLENPRAGLVEAVKSVTTTTGGAFELCGIAPQVEYLWGEHPDGRVAIPTAEVEQLKLGGSVPLDVITTHPMKGLVRLVDGTPLPDARVLAYSMPAILFRDVKTDGRGAFTTTLPFGSVTFIVAAPGRAPVALRRDVEPNQLTLLEVPDPFTLTIRARANGQNVEGAEVTIGKEPAQLTNAKGEAVLTPVLDDENALTVRVVKGGLIGTATVRPQGARSQSLDVELKPGVRVRGVVVDEKGAPRIGRVQGFGPPLFHDTDAQGRFESELVEPTREDSLRGVVPDCDSERSQWVELAGADVNVVVKVRCEPTVNGLVLDGEGAPIANAMVSLQSSKDGETATTDATGRFVLHQPAGEYRLKVSHERYREAEQPLTVPAKDVTVVLDAGGSIAGKVVDASGAPLAGVEVMAIPGMLEDMLRELEGSSGSKATTDGEGRFQVKGLLAGRWVLVANGAGQPSTPSDPVLLQPGSHQEGVIITIDAKVDVSGTAVDEKRQPIPGVRVSWEPADEKAAISSLLFDAVQGRMGEAARFLPSNVFTDAEGHFELRGIPVSSVRVIASADGFSRTERPASRGDKIELTLKREGGRITGRVVDSRGQVVTSFSANGADFSSPDGRFEVKAYTEKDSVRVKARGFVPTTKDVTMDAPVKDVGDVVLEQGLSLKGEATGDDGKPLEGVRIAAVQSEAGDSCTTRADGTCTMAPFRDEEVVVKARKQGFVPVETKVAKGALGDGVKVKLTAAGGRVQGQVFGGKGRPAAARSISISAEAAFESVLSDAQGRFEASGLPEGAYCASVELSGMLGTDWAVPVQVTTTPSPIVLGPVETGATLEFSAKLPGRIVMLGGAQGPLPSGDIGSDSASSFCEKLKVPVVTVVNTGSVRFEGLPAGKWSIYVVQLLDSDEKQPITPKVLDLLPGETKKVQ